MNKRSKAKPQQPTASPLTLRAQMQEKLKQSGLDEKDAKAHRFEPFTESESIKLSLSRSGAGFKIPYFDARGKQLPNMFRYRYFKTTGPYGGNLNRYDQPKGSSVEIYLSPLIEWPKIVNDPSQAVLITEGELKAACGCKYIMPTIGLGGVDCWGGKKQGQALHPTLAAFVWKSRQVTIMYDSDAANNPNVRRSANQLAAALLNAGATVRVLFVPADGEKKIGLDDHVVAHGSAPLRKLIEQEKEWRLSREVHELAARYVFVRGISMFAELPSPAVEQVRLHPPRKFCDELEAPRRCLSDEGKWISAAKEFLRSPSRPEVEKLDYVPGAPLIVGNTLNIYKPSGIVARKGSTEPFDRLLARLISCETQRDQLQRWAAYPLQFLGKRSNYAVMLWSRAQGTGKGVLGSALAALHGESNFSVIGQEQLAAPFNGWLRGITFCMGNELCGDSARDARVFADKMKPLISDDWCSINEKFQPLVRLSNPCSFFLTSNHATALHLTAEARRYFVIESSSAKMSPTEYTEFARWRDNGGLSALLYKLQTLDLADYQPGADAPRTAALEEMIEAGRSDEQAWAFELAEDSVAVLERDGRHLGSKKNEWTVATAHDLLCVLKRRLPNTRCTPQRLGNYLADAGLHKLNNGKLIRLPEPLGRERIWWVGGKLRAANLRTHTPAEIARIYAAQHLVARFAGKEEYA